jgi:3-isopropylmalate dehydratase small subunit
MDELIMLEDEMADIDAEEGDILEVDVNEGTIINITQNKEYKIKAFDKTMLDILESGGLVNNYLKQKEE